MMVLAGLNSQRFLEAPPDTYKFIRIETFWEEKPNQTTYRHSPIYAINVGHKKKLRKQKPCKSRLLSSTKEEENGIELKTAVNWKSWKS